MLCNNFKLHSFHFYHCQKPNVPSFLQVRKTNVNKQCLFLAFRKRFFRCFCCRQRSHRCFTGQTISPLRWLRWPQLWQSGQHRCSTVVRITQTNRLSAWEALSATATVYFATCVVFVHASFNYRTASTGCHGVINRLPYQCCTTNRVDVNWPVTAIIRFRLESELNADDTTYSFASAPSWTQTTVKDEHKFSAIGRLSRRLLDRS